MQPLQHHVLLTSCNRDNARAHDPDNASDHNRAHDRDNDQGPDRDLDRDRTEDRSYPTRITQALMSYSPTATAPPPTTPTPTPTTTAPPPMTTTPPTTATTTKAQTTTPTPTAPATETEPMTARTRLATYMQSNYTSSAQTQQYPLTQPSARRLTPPAGVSDKRSIPARRGTADIAPFGQPCGSTRDLSPDGSQLTPDCSGSVYL